RDRQILLTKALLARLRGQEARGAASIYDGCSLSDLQTLANISVPRGARLGGVSGDWPIVLTDAYEKRMIDFYSAGNPAYRAITRRVPLTSYRQATLVRPGEFPALKQVGEGGEVEEGVVADGGERIALTRFARIFSVSSIAFVNDDLGALNSAAEQGAQ